MFFIICCLSPKLYTATSVFHQLQAYKSVVQTITSVQMSLDLKPYWHRELHHHVSNPLKLVIWLSSNNLYPQYSAQRVFYLDTKGDQFQSTFCTGIFDPKVSLLFAKEQTELINNLVK